MVATQRDEEEYELRSSGEVLATLKFRNSCGTLATAESDDGCCTFKRTGFWQNRASIRACGSDTDLGWYLVIMLDSDHGAGAVVATM